VRILIAEDGELRRLEFAAAGGDPFSVSFSAGLAEYPTHGGDLQTLYLAADAALYRAKDGGRARVVTAETPAA
jgi:PleD family two-component response regulator